MILQLRSQTQASIRQICHVLELPRSSFYLAAGATSSQVEDTHLRELIEEIFKREGRADRPSDNLLAQQPMPPKSNEAWAGDITFIPTTTRWLYLAMVIDLGSRRIIVWSLKTHMRAELVVHPLKQALEARPQAKSPHTLFHSDRGSQYGSSAFRAVLAGAGMRQSMSARANPYDNAWSESFIGTLKREMIQDGCFEDSTEAELELFEYIDGYYNNQRKHSAIGYLTPNQFEAQQSNLN